MVRVRRVKGRAQAAAAALWVTACALGVGGTDVFPILVMHVYSLANFRLDHVVGQGPV